MSIKSDANLKKEDLLFIESVLYEAKREELVARQLVKVNTNYPEYAQEVGYDWFDANGSAKILAAGGSANDIPFVGEKGGRETAKVYTIATGIRYTQAERLAIQSKNALGKGPSISLDTIRVAAARRYVAEVENRLFFKGDSTFNITGVLNKSGITSESVAEGATGADAAAKRLWTNKTPKEMLEDILKSIETVEAKGIFSVKAFAFPQSAKFRLMRPYSDQNPMTLMNWLRSEGGITQEIVFTNALDASNSGLSVACFVALDNSPEIIELAVPQDLKLGQPVYDLLETSEQAVTEKTAGAIIRHPAAIYVGKGI